MSEAFPGSGWAGSGLGRTLRVPCFGAKETQGRLLPLCSRRRRS